MRKWAQRRYGTLCPATEPAESRPSSKVRILQLEKEKKTLSKNVLEAMIQLMWASILNNQQTALFKELS